MEFFHLFSPSSLVWCFIYQPLCPVVIVNTENHFFFLFEELFIFASSYKQTEAQTETQTLDARSRTPGWSISLVYFPCRWKQFDLVPKNHCTFKIRSKAHHCCSAFKKQPQKTKRRIRSDQRCNMEFLEPSSHLLPFTGCKDNFLIHCIKQVLSVCLDPPRSSKFKMREGTEFGWN